MGKALAEAFTPARQVFAEVDEALQQKLSTLMFEGPEAELTLTANAQPALMATSLAVLRVLETEAGLDLGRDAAFVAGHSLGEYSALAAAGAFSIADAARLLRRRGEAMQQAVPVGVGAMAALSALIMRRASLSLPRRQQGNRRTSAPSPMTMAAARSSPPAPKPRSKRRWRSPRPRARAALVPLAVSAPFHCRVDAARRGCDGRWRWPRSISGARKCRSLPMFWRRAVEDPDEIRQLLVAQVTGTVRWRESVPIWRRRASILLSSLVAGKVLTGLLKRIVADAQGVAVGTPERSMLIKALSAMNV